MESMETAPTIQNEPLTAGQRRALFSAARARGLNVDDLRSMTPLGSISAMTRAQAAHLLTRLNAGTDHAHPRVQERAPRRPKGLYGLATAAQRRKVEALRIDLGWSTEGLAGFLSERHFIDGRRMDRIDSLTDASEVIELLKAVRGRSRPAIQEDAEIDGFEAASTTCFVPFD